MTIYAEYCAGDACISAMGGFSADGRTLAGGRNGDPAEEVWCPKASFKTFKI
jgi:hypothetical protein